MGMLDDERSGSKKEKAPRSVAEAKNRGNLRTLARTESKKLLYTKKTLVKVRA
jgi:hypothetical protein